MAGTNLFSPVTSTLSACLTDESGLIYFAKCTGVPPTTANIFAKGAIIISTDALGTTSALYTNTGTSGTPVFTATGMQTLNTAPITIATTSTSDTYVIAPQAGRVQAIYFSGIDALATSDTNYITFSATNLGQAGAGTAAFLAATAANTTKATGGTAIAANTKRTLTLSSTAADLVVAAGDRIRVRATATGTLDNTVTGSTYTLVIS